LYGNNYSTLVALIIKTLHIWRLFPQKELSVCICIMGPRTVQERTLQCLAPAKGKSRLYARVRFLESLIGSLFARADSEPWRQPWRPRQATTRMQFSICAGSRGCRSGLSRPIPREHCRNRDPWRLCIAPSQSSQVTCDSARHGRKSSTLIPSSGLFYFLF
jgi:hypothetical protein